MVHRDAQLLHRDPSPSLPPLFLGFGFLWNSPSYGYVNVTPAAAVWHSNATLNADFFLVTTPADPPANTSDPVTLSPFAQMLSGLVSVTGFAPPMPYYATGFIQVSRLCLVAGGAIPTCGQVFFVVVVGRGSFDARPQAYSSAPPPPLGHPQSKNRYRNQTQLLDVARGYVCVTLWHRCPPTLFVYALALASHDLG